MGLRWYVARTQPRAEFLAANELVRDGHQVFFPRVKAVLPRVGHPDLPLFPGYLFLQCDPDNGGWPSFRPAHRIIGWVRFGGEIPWLPDETVTALMERSEMINRQGGLWRQFLPGDKVDVVSGTLNGMAEVIEAAKSPHARVQVLLQFMGRIVRAQIPWENLRPIEDPGMERPRHPRRTRGKGRWVRDFRPASTVGA